jgi:pre-mRNA-processing factor SLU7
MPGKEQEAARYAGENFMRYTGEAAEANEAQVFAWQARCKGIDIHSLAEPTRLEALKHEFEQQKEQNKSSVQNELLEKYGGKVCFFLYFILKHKIFYYCYKIVLKFFYSKEHLSVLPKELLLSQSENYVEYNRKGKVIKGDEAPAAKSKYEEDAYVFNIGL